MAENNKEEKEKVGKEERPVGDILKDEGVVAPEAAEPKEEKIKKRDETEDLLKLEKLEAQVSALKEVKFQADERIKELAESIGELRSMLFQRDAEIEKTVAKVEKLGEAVSEVNPEKITKALQKGEEELDKNKADIEKQDTISHDILKRVESLQKILDNIKSIENLVEITKDIDAKTVKINELNDDIKRTSGKVERFYLDMDRKLSQLNVMEGRVSKIEELNKELLSNSENIAIQMKNLVTKEEMENAVRDMIRIPESSNIEDLNEQKKEIEARLKNLKDQYSGGIISEESYNEVYGKNTEILEQLEERVKEVGMAGGPKDLQSWIETMDKMIRNIETKLKISDEKIQKIEVEVSTEFASKKKTEDELNKLKLKVGRGAQPAKEAHAAVNDQLKHVDEVEIDEIKSLLSSLEDEYRRGLVSEDTYREVRERNMQKLREMEKPVSPVPAEPGEKKADFKDFHAEDEIIQIENKLSELKTRGVDTSELESMVKAALKKRSLGFSSIAKVYLDSIKERLMEYEWS